MELSIDDIKQIALDVYDVVHPLLGTKEGALKSEKGAGGDITMFVDTVAERAVVASLERLNVDILLISEEIGETYIGNKEKAMKNQNVLIVDPVDGSNNAVRGIPYCSVSIAYAIGKNMGDIILAVVLDLTSKDIYWAIKGKGAYFNDEKIHVSDLEISDKCFFELDLPMGNLFEQMNKLKTILKRFYRVRVLGSSALTLCLLAKGSIEAFLNLKGSNRLVDVAAGFLILKEAGGTYFSVQGTEIDEALNIELRFPFIATNSKLENYLKKELFN
jgi:myo-inositol-1(or 4)-monophosphatase